MFSESEFADFDPSDKAAADKMDAGLYLMKIIVNDNSGKDRETCRVFEVSKALAKATTPVAKNDLVYTGEPLTLVEEDPDTVGGKFYYTVRKVGEYDGEPLVVEEPKATEAGAYIVKYRFVPDLKNYHYYGVMKGSLKVVIEAADDGDDEPGDVTPSGGDDEPGDVTPPGGDDEPGDVTPEEDETPTVDEVFDGRLPGITAKKPAAGKASVVVKWKRLSKKNSRKCTGIEVMVSRDWTFKSCCVTRVAGSRDASYKIGKLGRKTTYFVKVRTFKYRNGVKYVGKWSKVKKVRTR
jgi:hypothetical protein